MVQAADPQVLLLGDALAEIRRHVPPAPPATEQLRHRIVVAGIVVARQVDAVSLAPQDDPIGSQVGFLLQHGTFVIGFQLQVPNLAPFRRGLLGLPGLARDPIVPLPLHDLLVRQADSELLGKCLHVERRARRFPRCGRLTQPSNMLWHNIFGCTSRRC